MAEQNKILESESEWREQLRADNKSTNRFVAFLDIMGFKDRVGRSTHEELREQLTRFNIDIIDYIRKYGGQEIEMAQFSDSIVVFSKDDSLGSLRILAEVTRGIMQTAISQQIPLKGAIAQGKVTCDFSKQLFFGQALIDAYLLEESIHYYGILIHHSAERSVREFNRTNQEIFKDIKAPLKSGKISHYELSWYLDDDAQNAGVKIKEVISALTDIRNTVSDAPRKYIDNTFEVIERDYRRYLD